MEIGDNDALADTYFDFDCAAGGCTDWLHGALFVNGFNVGRYFQVRKALPNTV